MFSTEKNIPVSTAQRLQKWALTLMAYQYDIRYKPTAQHGNADGLSKLPIGANPEFDHDEENESIEISHTIQEELDHSPLDDEAVKQEAMKYTSLQIVKEWILNGLLPNKLTANYQHLRPYWNMRKSLLVHGEAVLLQRDGTTRVVIPQALRRKSARLAAYITLGCRKSKAACSSIRMVA
ncbi:uncharacterized protein [Watersipora subatra]|uniref:uncharacterized protein n=1 Tax=Watersipora subatra TaxID=2589382 RepID=UPI00355AF872